MSWLMVSMRTLTPHMQEGLPLVLRRAESLCRALPFWPRFFFLVLFFPLSSGEWSVPDRTAVGIGTVRSLIRIGLAPPAVCTCLLAILGCFIRLPDPLGSLVLVALQILLAFLILGCPSVVPNFPEARGATDGFQPPLVHGPKHIFFVGEWVLFYSLRVHAAVCDVHPDSKFLKHFRALIQLGQGQRPCEFVAHLEGVHI